MNKEEIIEEFIEKGADLEHERWSGWQSYFFSKCQVKPQSQVGGMDDRYVYFALPKDLYERWGRQMNTPYSELSEQEKESDRKEVRQYLPLIDSILTQHTAELKKKIERLKMKELPKKLKLHSQEGMNEMVLQSWYKINEILDYLESQKDGEEPKQIDVERLLTEYADIYNLKQLGYKYDQDRLAEIKQEIKQALQQ